MLIGYPAPEVTGIDLENGEWLTAGDGQQLVDGLPARIARLEQAGGDPVITLTFAAEFAPRIIGLIGLSCAPGTSIVATSGDDEALGGNAAIGLAGWLPDGSVAAWIVTDGDVSTNAIKVSIGAAGVIDVGEIVVLPAVDIAHELQWAFTRIDPSVIGRTRGSQVTQSVRRSYRQLRAAFVPAALAEVRAGGLIGGLDWDQLAARVVGGERVVAIPRWLTTGGEIDVAELHRTAIYGVATTGGGVHLGGDYYGADNGWTFDEIPPL